MALRDRKFCAKHPLQEEIMALSKEDRVRELARLVDIPIMESEIAEVADRFDSLLQELARLTSLDLADIQPVTIFPEEE
jgi:Asp-tRNA(Asn)/Glu-tRNA(Gln) amidotransferase C subunit